MAKTTKRKGHDTTSAAPGVAVAASPLAAPHEKIPTHPLRAKRKPGPAGADAPLAAEQDLANASAVLSLIESGAMEKGVALPPLDIPCDVNGRPKRRLTVEDERELAYRIQVYGDVDARNIFVLANLGLVHLLSNQMRRAGVKYDDLVQEGTLGLLRATETFDPDRGVRFSTYCVYWIRAKIQRFLQRLDRDDVPVIGGADMEEDADGNRKRPRARALSMERPVDGQPDRTLADVIAAPGDTPLDTTLRSEVEVKVDRVLHEIAEELGDPRLKTIIDRRLLAEEPDTLAVLGDALNLSREGARLLENKVLNLAKQRLGALAGAA